ncbi:MAG: carbohydrate ABC transporter permease [Actinomycetota bacterium]
MPVAQKDPAVPTDKRMSASQGRASLWSKFSFGRATAYAVFTMYAASAIFGFIWIFSASMKTNQEFIGSRPWEIAGQFTISNYIEALDTANMAVFMMNSIWVATGATALGILVAALAAYPIARMPFKGSKLMLSVFLMGMMVPWVVTFIPLFSVLQTLGLLDSRMGLIVVYATYNLPFNIFVFTAFMATLSPSLEDAAAVDGAGRFRTFFTIILPLVGPAVISVGIISFLRNWNEFFFALAFVTSEEKLTLPIGLFRLGIAAQYGSNWVVLFAGLLIAAVPILIAFAFLQQRITTGLTAGGTKG